MKEEIKDIIIKAAEKAEKENSDKSEPEYINPVNWPVDCTIGPGLEGAIACESKIGYVNGIKGRLIYRSYSIFDLCAHSTFEEVSFLLLHGNLPKKAELKEYKNKLSQYRLIQGPLRSLMNFPVEKMNTMAALRLGTMLLLQKVTYLDQEIGRPNLNTAIASDDDSIPMETPPKASNHALFEFKQKKEKWKKINEHWYDMTQVQGLNHAIV